MGQTPHKKVQEGTSASRAGTVDVSQKIIIGLPQKNVTQQCTYVAEETSLAYVLLSKL